MLDLQIITVTFDSEELIDINHNILDFTDVSYSWLNIKNNQNDIIIQCDKITNIDNLEHNINGSIHHGIAINKALKIIGESRYLLILDPDFFVFQPIKDILDMMENGGLDFWGAAGPVPNFPCAFCMFIDLRKVDINTLNFIPIGDYKVPKNTFRNDKERREYSKDTSFRIYDQSKHKHNFDAIDILSADIPQKYYLNNKIFAYHFRAKLFRLNKTDRNKKITSIRNELHNIC